MGNQVKIKEYVLLVDDVVVAFQIKNIFTIQVALLVEIVFDDEGHVAMSQIQIVTEQDEVVGLDLHSMSRREAKRDIILIEVIEFQVIGLYFAALYAIYDVIFLD